MSCAKCPALVFGTQVRFAQLAGAVAVIVYDDVVEVQHSYSAVSVLACHSDCLRGLACSLCLFEKRKLLNPE